MAQPLAEILAQLDSVYNPRKQVVQQQMDTLPGQEEAAVGELGATRDREYGAIDVVANDRGLSYSGKPLADRGTYQQTTFLPGRAAIKSDFTNRRFQLQGALTDLEAERTKQGYGIYNDQYQADRAKEAALEAERMRAATAASAARASSAGLNFGSMSKAAAPAAAPQQKTVVNHFQEDVATLLNDYKNRYNPGYTERTVIPKLQKLYPELNPTQVAQMVYAFRKQNYGE